MELQVHPGYPDIIRLAERLGVPELKEGAQAGIIINCGANGTRPAYSFATLIHAALDKIDAATT